MPVRAELELQTLNVEKLNLKTNLYGNILIPPFNGKVSDTLLQKAKSLDKVNLTEVKSIDNRHTSMVSIESSDNGNGQLKKLGLEPPKGINRYDSGYESITDFHSETNFSSRETLLEEPDHLNDFEISENDQYVITEWPTYTTEALSSTYDPYSASSSVSPTNDSSVTSLTISPPPILPLIPVSENKRNEYIRKVERFGDDMKDTCLFPLALPMDGSDVYKGASTWESIALLADCVLSKWVESAQKNYKPINQVLPNASKFFCPNLELEARIMQYPNIVQPLRRTKSELDLWKLDFNERKGLVTSEIARNQAKSRGAKDDININVSNEKGRYRTQTSLSIRRNSVKFSVSKARKDRFDLKVSRNLKTDAKALIQSIRIENPISLALQITKIEKDLMLNLPNYEIMSVVINRGKYYNNKNGALNKLMEFGQELSELIADIIAREITVEAQGKKIAAIIEVACVLRKLRNWQSLSSLIRGLQLPQIYRLSTAWSVTKAKYPIHFRDYLRLSQVVSNSNVAILRSREPSIPSISSFASLLRIRCLATWDRLEEAPRWRESPNLVQWLETQMLTSIAIQNSITNSNQRISDEFDKKRKKQKQIKLHIKAFHEKKETHLEKCLKDLSPERASFMPLNDPIYFIEDDHLPTSWTLRSARNIPASHQSKIIRCFNNSFKIYISNIDKYNINS